ncbi:MAG TPA: D-aminoacylase [Gemmatimonadales bacterium]|jgi:N-acyl-D-amino-acid deacylase|nr:D-aminoacylase [Gemmatimonadales bacterium]
MPTRRDFVLAALAAPALRLPSRRAYDLILRGGLVLDGSGAAGKVADLAIGGGVVRAVAARIRDAGSDEIDARGLAVSPGFIDIHSHADGSLFDDPRVESVLRQGVTTIVVGQDGSSRIPSREGATDFQPLFQRIEALPSSVNVASMVGLGTVRRVVVGLDNRPATSSELAKMSELVEAALASGACGASTGLEYTPGAFASKEELAALCRPLAARRLPYATHLRNEDDELLEAIEEAIAIAKSAGCPLQISHLKTGGPRNWHKIDTVFERIAKARAEGLDLTFDRYPYVAWATGLTTRFPVWARDGGTALFLKRLEDSTVAGRIREETEADVVQVGGWDKILLTDVSAAEDKAAVGQRLAEWARAKNLEPYQAAVALLKSNGGSVGTVVFAMSEENCERFLAHPQAMVCSDGGAHAVSGPAHSGHPHPRGLGTFPRVLGRYVRERKALTLAQAVHKMTGKTAARLRLTERGRIAVGAAADVVVFDPATIADKATFEEPFQYPSGIPHVIVNGVIALRDGERVGKGAGRGIRPA